MFVHHIGYRFENGTVEEFAGRGMSPAAARQDGVQRAKAAVALVAGERFSMNRVVAEAATDASDQRSDRNAAIGTKNYLSALL